MLIYIVWHGLWVGSILSQSEVAAKFMSTSGSVFITGLLCRMVLNECMEFLVLAFPVEITPGTFVNSLVKIAKNVLNMKFLFNNLSNLSQADVVFRPKRAHSSAHQWTQCLESQTLVVSSANSLPRHRWQRTDCAR